MYKQIFKKVILMIIGLFFMMSSMIPVDAQWSLTEEEKAYVKKGMVIKAVSLEGIAPLQYTDSKGEVQGISKRVLEEISDMTGLVFEYRLYDSLEEGFNSGADIFFGIPHNYTPEGMTLSLPYLKSETILYINSSLDSKQLEDKIYAAVKGSALPEGIEEENSIYFDTREESLNAVEAGEADYGYGNAYSVAFYTLQNDYQNIVTIPKGKESREYCIGFLKDNEMLYNIINKSINAIDENQMQNLILDVTSHIERKITFSMILDAYGKEIFSVIFVVMSMLLFSVISNIRVNNRLRMQNRRYEALSHISNEYLYEYHVKGKRLELSEKCAELFGTHERFEEAADILKKALSNNHIDEATSMIKLPLANGDIGVFKAISLNIHDDQGKLDSFIGKLIDISKEAAEKEALLVRSKIDGLTGLYNAITTKELITERIKNRDKHKTDAFLLMDCDKFKDINDTFGHLKGNQVLEHVGKNLKHSFRNTDIIGRIGGDEFCVYIPDIPSVDFVQEKCQQFNLLIGKTMDEVCVSVSIGIVLVDEEKAYDDFFKKADDALYQAKASGRAQVVIYNSVINT